MLEPQLTRKKSVRECTCLTTKPREEGQELTTLEPEKVSDKKNGTMELTSPSVKSNGTDYNSFWDDGFRGQFECDAKTESWTVPGLCLHKCSNNKNCNTEMTSWTCKKICLFDEDIFLGKKPSKNGKLSHKQKQKYQAICKKNNWVLMEDRCYPTCKTVSDCSRFKNGNVRCESVCV